MAKKIKTDRPRSEAVFLYPKGGEGMEEYKADLDNAKMAEEFIVDVEKAFEKLSEMGFEEFTQIS